MDVQRSRRLRWWIEWIAKYKAILWDFFLASNHHPEHEQEIKILMQFQRSEHQNSMRFQFLWRNKLCSPDWLNYIARSSTRNGCIISSPVFNCISGYLSMQQNICLLDMGFYPLAKLNRKVLPNEHENLICSKFNFANPLFTLLIVNYVDISKFDKLLSLGVRLNCKAKFWLNRFSAFLLIFVAKKSRNVSNGRSPDTEDCVTIWLSYKVDKWVARKSIMRRQEEGDMEWEVAQN